MNLPKLDFKAISRDPVLFVAFGFGAGLSPKAPGTVGSLAAFPFYWLLASFISPFYIPFVLVLFFLLGIYCCEKAGSYSGIPDHPAIVWDEIVAMLFIFAAIPSSLLIFGIAFLLFRFFDILKPWPICYVDKKFKNGFGVMFDDVLAAVYSIICLWAYSFFFS